MMVCSPMYWSLGVLIHHKAPIDGDLVQCRPEMLAFFCGFCLHFSWVWWIPANPFALFARCGSLLLLSSCVFDHLLSVLNLMWVHASGLPEETQAEERAEARFVQALVLNIWTQEIAKKLTQERQLYEERCAPRCHCWHPQTHFVAFDSKKILPGLKEERERRVRHFLRKLPSTLCFAFCLRLFAVCGAGYDVFTKFYCLLCLVCTTSTLVSNWAMPKVQRQQKRKLWIIGQFRTSGPQK